MCVADWGRSMIQAPKRELTALVCALRKVRLAAGFFSVAGALVKRLKSHATAATLKNERASSYARR